MAHSAKLVGKRACLLDLSGTLHIEDQVLHNAVSTVQKLRQHFNGRVKFVTNTTKESSQTLLNRLQKLGFDVTADQIFSSLTAARRFVDQRQLRPMCMLSADALHDFADVDTTETAANCVLVGLAPDQFHYERMTQAMRLLLDGAHLVAIHKARYFKRADGLALGPGAIVSALEYSTGCQASVVGKPSRAFFESALDSLQCADLTLADCVMVGDDWRDDVQGAIDCGATGVLVRTGKYRDGDENNVQCEQPDRFFAVDNIDGLIDLL